MRTAYEDDLRSSGRLSKVARYMGWRDREALGALMFFYRHTQDAELIDGTREQILTLIVVEHDSDDEAWRFIDAMEKARLLTKTGDTYHIHGNSKHVERVFFI